MSTNRVGALRRTRKDKVSGKWLCRNCGKPCSGRRTSWCSDACLEEAGIKAWPAFARQKVHQRDHGVCARCGIDCEALAEAIRGLQPTDPPTWGSRRVRRWQDHTSTFCQFLKVNGLKRDRSMWEAHHRHAVIEGGGECGLDGYETLCWRCHNQETHELRRRISLTKRAKKYTLFN